MDNKVRWEDLTPIQKLFRSRKFLLTLMDTIVSLIILFAGLLYIEATVTTITLVIGLLQPVFVMLIGAIAYEDGKYLESLAAGSSE